MNCRSVVLEGAIGDYGMPTSESSAHSDLYLMLRLRLPLINQRINTPPHGHLDPRFVDMPGQRFCVTTVICIVEKMSSTYGRSKVPRAHPTVVNCQAPTALLRAGEF